MNISELQPGQGKVDVTGKLVEIGEARTFQKFGREGRVATAKLQDETGEIKLSLWNDQIDRFKAGDTVQIQNGYVNEWQGEKQLTTGKFGKIEKVSAESGEPEEKAPEEILEEKEKKTDVREMQSDKGSHVLSDDEIAEEEALDEGLGKPDIEDSVTHDEETEAAALEGQKKPADNLEAETDAEMNEEDIKVEEEEI